MIDRDEWAKRWKEFYERLERKRGKPPPQDPRDTPTKEPSGLKP